MVAASETPSVPWFKGSSFLFGSMLRTYQSQQGRGPAPLNEADLLNHHQSRTSPLSPSAPEGDFSGFPLFSSSRLARNLHVSGPNAFHLELNQHYLGLDVRIQTVEAVHECRHGIAGDGLKRSIGMRAIRSRPPG